jgi:hypothetical protein
MREVVLDGWIAGANKPLDNKEYLCQLGMADTNDGEKWYEILSWDDKEKRWSNETYYISDWHRVYYYKKIIGPLDD